jgi:hypothetical protein
MTFFNKKEEVMKIELTPHGRYLLSIGKLKPHSYRFFDENVIYDSSACEQGGTIEEQNTSHVRITSETPLLKLNGNFTGVETNMNKFTSDSVAIKDMRDPISDDQLSTNSESIGTCAYDTDNSTAFAIDLFGQTLITEQISSHYSSSSGRAQIPQIPINMFVSASAHEDIQGETFTTEYFTSYDDGSGYSLDYINPILRMREFSGFDEKDNFEITAYKVSRNISTTPIGSWRYDRLMVDQRMNKIVQNMLVIKEEETILDDPITAAGDNASEGFQRSTEELSFYIDITVDREIPDEEICNRVQDYEIENIFLDDEIICPDPELTDNYDIYGTFVDPSDLEDCD